MTTLTAVPISPLPITAAPESGPASFTAPSSARLTQWLLGGTHHGPADRRLGLRVLRAASWFERAVGLSHGYADRTVSMLREAGFRQFVDLGSGLPTGNDLFPPTVVSAGPESLVIHVDSDPYVIQHGPRLLNQLGNSSRHRFVHADLRHDMHRLLDGLRPHGLDPDRPAAFLLHNSLPWITHDQDARDVVGAILGWAPPGSVLSLTHLTADLCHDRSANAAARCFEKAGLPVRLQTAREIADLIEEQPLPWPVVAPGIAPVGLYYPTRSRAPVPARDSGAYAAIAIHPEPAHH
ncbi:SAM-dependent methyltransferase [Streptomyces sp. NPDC056061]|uniref:SAM-dependent methyltransferase n=1 Tax=Streptomyces sp. NPDC056061 TaxID=3345700 RepID=UPI0035E2C899